ncbi:MAG: Protein OS-9 [Watsoniomyces obsoletus]|nr:MAG: Protein OS-9 [Watsoniomyces obsoletus]
MGQNIVELDVDRLVPPLLACLSTASVSPGPSPALVQLLSPILRQRLVFLADRSNSNEPWLSYLSWEPDQARKLLELVERSPWEPHPVSGNIEFDLAEPVLFRKFDEDTFRSKVVLQDSLLEIDYILCTGSEDTGPEWRVGGLGVADQTPQDRSQWCRTLEEACAVFDLGVQETRPKSGDEKEASAISVDAEKDEEDAYWAQYDNEPMEKEASAISVDDENNEDSYWDRYDNAPL